MRRVQALTQVTLVPIDSRLPSLGPWFVVESRHTATEFYGYPPIEMGDTIFVDLRPHIYQVVTEAVLMAEP